jgi:hypothetical protein
MPNGRIVQGVRGAGVLVPLNQSVTAPINGLERCYG